MSVGGSDISGELKYVTGYTGFSGDPTEQEGHYLVLHIDTEIEGATIVCELIGGKHGPVTLDSDRTLITRISNKSQKIKITASKEGYDDIVKVYSLSGLTLDPKS